MSRKRIYTLIVIFLIFVFGFCLALLPSHLSESGIFPVAYNNLVRRFVSLQTLIAAIIALLAVFGLIWSARIQADSLTQNTEIQVMAARKLAEEERQRTELLCTIKLYFQICTAFYAIAKAYHLWQKNPSLRAAYTKSSSLSSPIAINDALDTERMPVTLIWPTSRASEVIVFLLNAMDIAKAYAYTDDFDNFAQHIPLHFENAIWCLHRAGILTADFLWKEYKYSAVQVGFDKSHAVWSVIKDADCFITIFKESNSDLPPQTKSTN